MMPMGSTPLSMLGAQMLVDALRDLSPVLPEKERADALRQADAPEPARLSLWPRGFLRHTIPLP